MYVIASPWPAHGTWQKVDDKGRCFRNIALRLRSAQHRVFNNVEALFHHLAMTAESYLSDIK